MKAYVSPMLEIVEFHVENVLAFSIEDDFETPVIPFKLPQIDLGEK